MEQKEKHKNLTIKINGDASNLNKALKKSRKLAANLNKELEKTDELLARIRS